MLFLKTKIVLLMVLIQTSFSFANFEIQKTQCAVAAQMNTPAPLNSNIFKRFLARKAIVKSLDKNNPQTINKIEALYLEGLLTHEEADRFVISQWSINPDPRNSILWFSKYGNSKSVRLLKNLISNADIQDLLPWSHTAQYIESVIEISLRFPNEVSVDIKEWIATLPATQKRLYFERAVTRAKNNPALFSEDELAHRQKIISDLF